MISEEVVTKTWEKMAQATEYDAQLIIAKMSEEQPLALGFLINLDDMPFNQNEREIVLYVGVTVWRMMLQSERRLRKVTGNKLRRAEDANLEWLERMETANSADFYAATQLLLLNYPESNVLRYIIEAIMEEDEDPDNIPVRDEFIGLAFLHLKILLDAFIASLVA
jgi:hypothetical protein